MSDRTLVWSTSYEHLTVAECFGLLRLRQLGRIGFVQDDVKPCGPVILPVNFVLDGDSIVVRTSPYGFIGRSIRRQEAALAVDEIDERTGVGWTVLVRGTAVDIPGHDAHQLRQRPLAWREGVHSLFLRIAPRVVTGRRYGSTSPARMA